jgi:hypothetical protein
MKKFEKLLLKQNDIEAGGIYTIKPTSMPESYQRFTHLTEHNGQPCITSIRVYEGEILTILKLERCSDNRFTFNGYKARVLYSDNFYDFYFLKSDFKLLKRVIETP